MKTSLFISAFLSLLLACNSEGTQSAPGTDSSAGTTANSEGTADNNATNAANADVSGANTPTANNLSTTPDAATQQFLMKAAQGGAAEVEAGNLATKSARDPSVKNFALMMVSDHTTANAEVKALATRTNVKLDSLLSAAPKAEHSETLTHKTGNEFDRKYMSMMVKDHEKTIALFEKAQNDVENDQVKAFVTNTLPKLRVHLDSAQAISKRLR